MSVRVGVIGCGFYAANHLHAWRSLAAEGAELAAVCDRAPAAAERAGAAFGVPHYTDAAAMLAIVRPGSYVLPAIVGACAGVWATILAPEALERFTPGAGTFEMMSPEVEVTRELGGLLIVAAWMVAIAVAAHRAKRRAAQ